MAELHVTTGLIAEVEVRFTGRIADERIREFEDRLFDVIEKALEPFFGPEATPELFDSPRIHTREENVWTDDGMLRTTAYDMVATTKYNPVSGKSEYDLRSGKSELVSEHQDQP
jgi:hypothetical protein